MTASWSCCTQHFMLVTGLLEQLKDDGRVVILSSVGHTRAPASCIEFDNLSGDKGYRPLSAYGQSKLANLLFAKELQRRFAGTKKTAYAVHPGPVSTNLARNTGRILSRVLRAIGVLFLKSVAEGAATSRQAHPSRTRSEQFCRSRTASSHRSRSL